MIALVCNTADSFPCSPLPPANTPPPNSPPKIAQIVQRQLPPTPRRPTPPPSGRLRPSQPLSVTPLSLPSRPSQAVLAPLASTQSKAPAEGNPHTPRLYSYKVVHVTPQAVRANGWKQNNAGLTRVHHFYSEAQRTAFLEQSPAIQRQIEEQKDYEYGIEEYLQRRREAEASVKKISKILVKKG
ncbi:MAG TPA: hypothetical protein VLE89_03075 [Chlamydiales bacterium]|nr:hypothetical protein [Chlamydiales bacterium]